MKDQNQNIELPKMALLLVLMFLTGMLVSQTVKGDSIPLRKFMKMCNSYYKKFNVHTKRDCVVVDYRGCGDVLVRCKVKSFGEYKSENDIYNSNYSGEDLNE